MPVPLKRQLLKESTEWITPGLLAEFHRLRLPHSWRDDLTVFEVPLAPVELERNRMGWDPGNYRQDLEAR